MATLTKYQVLGRRNNITMLQTIGQYTKPAFTKHAPSQHPNKQIEEFDQRFVAIKNNSNLIDSFTRLKEEFFATTKTTINK